MRLRLALAASTVVLLASPLAAQELREGEVKLKSGKVIKGKVADRGTTVVVELPNGITNEWKREDVDTITIYKSGEDEPGSKPKKTWLKFTLRDGRVLVGEKRQEGDTIIIITKIGNTKAETPVRADDIVGFEEVPAPDDEKPKDDAGPELQAYPDYEGRFVLERPGPEWHLLKRALSPVVRAQMNHGEKDAFVRVTVRPCAAPLGEPGKDTLKKVQVDTEAELKRDLSRLGGLRIEVGDLFGGKVYMLRYSGALAGESNEYEFLEARFDKNGLVYAVTAAAERKIFADLQPALRRALEGFSFLPTYGFDEAGYSDLEDGFEISRPTSEWRVISRPFDDKAPVEMRNGDARAFVRVEVKDAPPGASNKEAAEGWLKTRKETQKLTVDPVQRSIERGGYKLESFSYEGFEAGSSKLRTYRGAAAVVGKRLIVAIGEAPANEAGAAKLLAEVQTAIDGFAVHDPSSIADRIKKAEDAMKSLGEGIDLLNKKSWQPAADKFAEAIAQDSTFARARAMRAKAYKELKKWKEMRDDLETAARLDPRGDYQDELARSYYYEGMEFAADKRWPEAEGLVRRAYRSDSKDSQIRKDLLTIYQKWFGEVKKNVPEASALLGKIDSSGLDKEREFEKFLCDAYCDLGDSILAADKKKYASAEAYAKKALRIDKNNQRANALVAKCNAAERELEKAQPKKTK